MFCLWEVITKKYFFHFKNSISHYCSQVKLDFSTWGTMYVEIKYLLKCMPLAILTLRSENNFQVLRIKSFLQIILFPPLFSTPVSHTELFWQNQVESLQKAFHICKKSQTICHLVEKPWFGKNLAPGQQLIKPLFCFGHVVGSCRCEIFCLHQVGTLLCVYHSY